MLEHIGNEKRRHAMWKHAQTDDLESSHDCTTRTEEPDKAKIAVRPRECLRQPESEPISAAILIGGLLLQRKRFERSFKTSLNGRVQHQTQATSGCYAEGKMTKYGLWRFRPNIEMLLASPWIGSVRSVGRRGDSILERSQIKPVSCDRLVALSHPDLFAMIGFRIRRYEPM